VYPVDELDKALAALLAARTVPFADLRLNWGQIPSTPGLYAIYLGTDLAPSQGLVADRCLHAGASGIPKNGRKPRRNALQARVKEHYSAGGKGAGSDLVEKVKVNLEMDKKSAQLWISKNCYARWLSGSYEVEFIRWTEHRLLSVMQPLWGA